MSLSNVASEISAAGKNNLTLIAFALLTVTNAVFWRQGKRKLA